MKSITDCIDLQSFTIKYNIIFKIFLIFRVAVQLHGILGTVVTGLTLVNLMNFLCKKRNCAVLKAFKEGEFSSE